MCYRGEVRVGEWESEGGGDGSGEVSGAPDGGGEEGAD